ncbi:MAG: hypothetical protein IT384_02605 [Deltaproteobacteria bacterium]|nr:hypothetical protein [Deltaproteobacteria bacterium]
MPLILDRKELDALHQAAAGRRVDLPLLLEAGALALREGRLEDAEDILGGALIADPARAATWCLAGKVEEAMGAVDRAEQAYRAAIEIDEHAPAALALANLLAGLGRYEEAEALASWLALEGNDSELRKKASVLEKQIETRRSPRS